MLFQKQLEDKLKQKGTKIIRFVDISGLAAKQNKGFDKAILLAIPLSQAYLQYITNTTAYIKNMTRNNQIEQDEFHLTEIRTDKIADDISEFIKQNGFDAYSQSERNIEFTGYYNKPSKTTPLPHKTVACMAGMGWIGKHNLFVTPEFGSALSMCSVLTNAPLQTVLYQPQKSKCGNCNVCIEQCTPRALSGNTWTLETSRNELLDITKCTTCIECMVHCVFTQKYISSNYSRLP